MPLHISISDNNRVTGLSGTSRILNFISAIVVVLQIYKKNIHLANNPPKQPKPNAEYY